MPRETPELFTPDQVEELVTRLQVVAARVMAIKEVMVGQKIERIKIANSASYDRMMVDLKRWSRSAEDGLDEARRPPAKVGSEASRPQGNTLHARLVS
jgi:hypothetical protein